MKKFQYLLLLLSFMINIGIKAQIDGSVIKPVQGDYLLKNATIYTVTQGVLEGTDLQIKEGKISAIGKNLPDSDVTVVDCSGKYVYPGFIDAGTELGLVEVGSVEETQDYLELGKVTPQMQALTAVNPNAVAIPVTRVSGVTTVLTVPRGSYFSGTAALINLNGYTPDQMYAGFKGVVMRFPSSAKMGSYDSRSDDTIKKEAESALKEVNKIWEKGKTYHSIKSQGGRLEYYPEMEQLSKVISGELPLIIEVNAAVDIIAAIEWLENKDVEAIFYGVAEGWRVADKIAKANIPVITGPVLSIPSRESDRYNTAYSNPAKMLEAGVKVALRTGSSENVRNLPFHAGFAAAYGMGIDEALKAVSIYPAEIFKVDDQLGSLEIGKNATLFIADGDPFEPKTQILQVYIDGYKIPMTNRHIRLYQEFLDREMKPAE